MSECNQCERILERDLAGALAPEEQRQWELHRDSCSDCRRQWLAHQWLREAFAGLPAPPAPDMSILPPPEAAAARSRARPLTGRAWWIMASYWLAVSAAALFLLLRLQWPAPESTGPPTLPWWLVLVPFSFLPLLNPARWLRLLGRCAGALLR